MKVIEKTGRTVDEAIRSALEELGLGFTEVDVEVLEEPSKRFFGFVAGRPARVRVTPKEDAITRGARFLRELLEGMGLEARVEIRRVRGSVRLEVFGRNLGLLIGRRGQTLDALQHLVNLVTARYARRIGESESEGMPYPIIVDVEGYRRRREDTLTRLALRVAERVKREGRRIVLSPMSALERKIVHTALQGVNGVDSHSEGTEPHRRVVVCPRWS